ncbi:hypothetical protein EPUS_08236 [Endocarpon pusillum Z07020]|uniref:Uncharacterized protein n=1 Tax=Endocarpon pusillum (strain Z07020 / HMAS-L-300199) TaxID=1263415 RepID=U1HNI2_ENDPU|nr:uncharacterized protein EPUS_08236 [Endocarpon pusillum Z07020]ERF71920.1 hypothetical protein EPUS_08236 [Endocarpon pusillum Z07020]
MLLFAKIAMAVAATVSTLVGVWRVAEVLELQPNLTLPDAQSYFDMVRFGFAKPFFGMDKTGDAATTFIVPDSVTVETNVTVPRAIPYSCLSFDLPAMFWAQACSSQADPSLEILYPNPDEEAASYHQFVLEKLATFNTMLDYLFSLVEEPPTSALSSLGFGLVALFILGVVFVLGSVLYWGLFFVDLRGYSALATPDHFPNVTELALSDPDADDNDALSVVSDIVQSMPQNAQLQDEEQCLGWEMLAYATEISQAHADIVREDLRHAITKSVQDNKSEIGRAITQQHKLEQQLRTGLENVLEGNETNIRMLKKDLTAIRSKLDSSTAKWDNKLRATDDLITNLDTKINSKPNHDTVSKLETKLTKAMAASSTSVQSELKALKRVETSVSHQDTSIANVMKDFNALKSTVQTLAQCSTKQHQENANLLQQLQKERKHLAEVTKVLEEENQRTAEATTEISTRIEQLETSLESKTQAIGAQLGEQQGQLKEVQKEVESQAAGIVTTKKLANSKADAAHVKELENKFSGYVKNHLFANLSKEVTDVSAKVDSTFRDVRDVQGPMERKISKVAEDVTNLQHALNEVVPLKSQVANKVDKDILTAAEESMKADLLALSKELRSEADTVKSQLASKADAESLHKLNETISVAQSELKSIRDDFSTKIAIGQVTELKNSRRPIGPAAPKFPESSPSSGMEASKWVSPQNNPPSGSSVDVKASRSAGVEASKWASPRNDAQSGSSVDVKASQSAGIEASKWASPRNDPQSSSSAVVKPSRSAGMEASRWASSPNDPQARSSDDARSKWQGPQAAQETKSSTPDAPATPAKVDDSASNQSKREDGPGFSPASATTDSSKQLMASRWSTAPESAGALPIETPSAGNSAVETSQTPTAPKAMQAATAARPQPKPFKQRKYDYNNGPGPNGGQRRMTPQTQAHNRKRRVQNDIKCALSRFTPAQKAHARSCQDPVGRHFAEGSAWTWLNPILERNYRHYQVRPPPGWVAPSGPPLQQTLPSSTQEGEDTSDADEEFYDADENFEHEAQTPRENEQPSDAM